MIKVISEAFLRRICTSTRHFKFATASQTLPDARLHSFKTSENDPQKHTMAHVGQFYIVPPEENKIYLYGGLPKSYEIQTKTFNETCFMIRKPSVDIINCLKSMDYSKPAIRFVLFGKKGTGKSISLAHVLHYGYKAGFILVHVPWVPNWMRRCQERSNSETKEGYIDLNLDAAAWLIHFKSQNQYLLSNPDLKISADHVWSKREITPKDAPLTELIDHGINRIKYASDCIVVLADELKKLSRVGYCKTMVVIDGFNAFFYPRTQVFTDKKEMVHPHKVTITEAFLKLSKFDWNNAAVIATVDELAVATEDQKSHLPRYLLGQDGFEHLDPFVPIFVDNYTQKELTSCMNYYRERNWVRNDPNQDDELALLSAYNPYKLMQICTKL